MKTTKQLARELGILRKKYIPTSLNIENCNLAKQKAYLGQVFAYLVVLDFESTCWKDGKYRTQEIIEFPAVLCNTKTGQIESEFRYYVQPQEQPVLSDFCTALTGITQDQVEEGIPLSLCLRKFSHWLNQLKQDKNITFHPAGDGEAGARAAFVTWSDWDLGVCLLYEARRKQLMRPLEMNSWIDLRATYRKFYGRRPHGLNGALEDVGITFEGREHSGLHDARNTARLAWRMMRDGCIMNITKNIATESAHQSHLPIPSKRSGRSSGGMQPQSAAVGVSTPGVAKTVHQTKLQSFLCTPKGKKRKSTSPSNVKRKSTSPSSVKRKSTSPSSVKRKSTSPSSVKRKSTSPSSVKRKSTSPSSVKRKSTSPSSVKRKSTSPSSAKTRRKSRGLSIRDPNREKEDPDAVVSKSQRCGTAESPSVKNTKDVSEPEISAQCDVKMGPSEKSKSVSTIPVTKLSKSMSPPNPSTFSGASVPHQHQTATTGSCNVLKTPIHQVPSKTTVGSLSKIQQNLNGMKSTFIFKTPSPVHAGQSPVFNSSSMKATPPMCKCGRRSKRRLVQSPGPNIGRFFFTCGVRTSQYDKNKGCEFFQWEAESSGGGNSSRRVSRRVNSGSLSRPYTPVIGAKSGLSSSQQRRSLGLRSAVPVFLR